MWKSRNYLGLRILLTTSLILHIAGYYQFINPVYLEGILSVSRKWQAIAYTGAFVLLLEFFLVIAIWTKAAAWISTLITRTSQGLARLGWINILVYSLTVGLITYMVYGLGWSIHTPSIITILAIFWSASLAGCFLLKAWSVRQGSFFHLSWTGYLGISILFTAFVYRISSFFPDISTYPLTLTWSETSRYYYASLFFAERIYGFSVPPTVLHPSRYLMQAVPFILPNSPLWLHRLWQVLLWIGVTLFTSVAIIHRLSIPNRLWRWLACLWLFLYLLVGPVYYHLQIPVIIICLGFNRFEIRTIWQRNFVSLLSILAASAWVGISRINWFPVPGMLAAAFWFLEVPLVVHPSAEAIDQSQQLPDQSIKRILIYTIRPVAWVILGLSIAFLSQALYIYLSGNAVGEFTSSLSSGLLWYRIWPNSTYAIGILPGILLLSLPLLMIIGLRLSQMTEAGPVWQTIHYIRLLGLAAITIALFIAGLIVSVKIGGGSNLHNMDSYMVLLVAIAAGFFLGRIAPEFHPNFRNQSRNSSQAPQYLSPDLPSGPYKRTAIAGGLIITVLFSILGRAPISAFPDQNSIAKTFKEINRHIDSASQAGGEILFISNRHLITFQDLKDLRLVPEYERVFLMEMAMAGNSSYMDKFHDDLRKHRFSLIISEPLFLRQKDENEIFGEENNAWVENVSRYILCYYQESRRARMVDIGIYLPNPQPTNCP